jgi:hydroxymethylglutaryl-CoA reductase (NADPH)
MIAFAGNFCANEKATTLNWIEGRGKLVVCEAILNKEVVTKVLKRLVSSLLELNTIKKLIGFAMVGAIGGYNAHVQISFMLYSLQLARIHLRVFNAL